MFLCYVHNLLTKGINSGQITAFLDTLDNNRTNKFRKKKDKDVLLFFDNI